MDGLPAHAQLVGGFPNAARPRVRIAYLVVGALQRRAHSPAPCFQKYAAHPAKIPAHLILFPAAHERLLPSELILPPCSQNATHLFVVSIIAILYQRKTVTAIFLGSLENRYSLYFYAVRPPSTLQQEPVTKEARGDARK